MKKLLALGLILASLSGCTAPERSMDTLIDEGYTNVTIEGYAFFECTESSTFHTAFTGQRDGRHVEGAVCCSYFSCEVRLAH